MESKEIIIINGVDVSGCDELWLNSEKNYDSKCIRFKDVYSQCSYCKDNPNCEYKQLQKEKFENLNNRQMVESAEGLIYENSELIKNLEEKKQECEELKSQLETYSKMLDSTEFRVALTDVKTGEREVWRKLGNKAQRYEKALDYIKDICNVADRYELEELQDTILDIINKAKEQ